jgi:hypothetical protein
MPYVIKKTDGNIVANVTDGTIDTSSTSLTLIGKNYKGIGDIYNTNLVQLLENFSNSTPPNNKIRGQLWFNSGSNKLNVYDGSAWRPVGAPFVAQTRPGNLVSGDLWIDNASQQLKFYDGANLITAGPIYTANQGKTGWVVEEIIDASGNGRTVASMYVSDIRLGILNPEEFKPLLPVSGFTVNDNTLKPGLSFNTNVADNNINAPAQSAVNLIDLVDGELGTTKFVRSDKSGSIAGSLTVSGSNGITVGPTANFSLYIDATGGINNTKTYLSNQGIGHKLIIQTRGTGGFQDVITLNPTNKSVGIYSADDWQTSEGTTPTFNVNGDTTIQGSLTVIGAAQFVNQTTLQINDKNIELAVTETPTNTTADGAGITVLGGSNNDKKITWYKGGIVLSLSTLPCWELNDNIKIPATNSLYIGNNEILDATTLGSNVITSSLTTVGHLISLDVAKFNVTNSTLTVDPDEDLVISVNTTKIITLANKVRINNVANPSLQFDVANKDYVDRVKTSLNYLTIDITNFINPNIDAVTWINQMIPSISVNLGDLVRVLCLSYSTDGLSITVDRLVKVFECQLVTGVRTWVWIADV